MLPYIVGECHKTVCLPPRILHGDRYYIKTWGLQTCVMTQPGRFAWYYHSGRKLHLIPSISKILLQKWYHCAQYTKHHHMSLILLSYGYSTVSFRYVINSWDDQHCQQCRPAQEWIICWNEPSLSELPLASEIGSYDGDWHTNYNGITFVTSRILVEWSIFSRSPQ